MAVLRASGHVHDDTGILRDVWADACGLDRGRNALWYSRMRGNLFAWKRPWKHGNGAVPHHGVGGCGWGHLNRVECLRAWPRAGRYAALWSPAGMPPPPAKHSARRCQALRAAASQPNRRIVRAGHPIHVHARGGAAKAVQTGGAAPAPAPRNQSADYSPATRLVLALPPAPAEDVLEEGQKQPARGHRPPAGEKRKMDSCASCPRTAI